MRDLHSNIRTTKTPHLVSGVYTSTQTPANGVSVAGGMSLEFLICIGSIANIANSPQPSWSFKVQESDTVNSDFTDVVDPDDLLVESSASPLTSPDSSTGVFLTVDHADNDSAVYRVGYIGSKAYARIVAVATNTPGNTPLAILAIQGHLGLRPSSDS